MRMGQGVRTGLGHGASPVSYRHNFLVCGIILLCNFPYRKFVHSITLIPFEIISQNLDQILSMTRQHREINKGHSTYIFVELFPFLIFRIEIVSAL